jgi:4-amino-4-deoxy-L-arabinose transferase-like glycosyltransferase
MGTALAPLAYGLARAAGIRWLAALLAGLLMAANGQAIQSSLVLMADIPALFWACLSAFALLVGLRSKRPAGVGLAGLLLGMAVITRWANLLLAVPFAATFIAGRAHWRTALWGMAGFALIVAPQLLISAGSPYPVLNHPWVQGWLPLNAFARDFVNVDGMFHYAQVNGWFYAAPALDPYFLAPLVLPLIAIGVFVLRGPSRWLFLGWALLGWLFLAGIPYQNIRFGLLLSPPLAVLAGAGFDWLWEKGADHRAWRGGLAGATAVALVWMVGASLPRVTEFLGRQQTDQETVQWASARIPAGVTVYANGLTYALRYATGRPVVELYGFAPAALAADAKQGDMVLVNRWQIENQWAGTPLQEAIHQLIEDHGLRRIGRYGYYTLYEVNH